jgi:hypothetical protein
MTPRNRLGILINDRTTETETETNYKGPLPPVDDLFFRIITCSVVLSFPNNIIILIFGLNAPKK